MKDFRSDVLAISYRTMTLLSQGWNEQTEERGQNQKKDLEKNHARIQAFFEQAFLEEVKHL